MGSGSCTVAGSLPECDGVVRRVGRAGHAGHAESASDAVIRHTFCRHDTRHRKEALTIVAALHINVHQCSSVTRIEFSFFIAGGSRIDRACNIRHDITVMRLTRNETRNEMYYVFIISR